MQQATRLPETIQLPGEGPLADQLFHYLRRAIVQGSVPAGARMREVDIAARAKVSRTPVVQALRRLEAAGLLRETRNGLQVRDLSADELSEACEVRDDLEALASQKAAFTRTELDLSLLEELCRRFEAGIGGEVAAMVELNHRFHEAVWDAARNSYLRDNLQQTRDLIERLDSTTLADERRQCEALEEHRAILGAIADRDPDRARALTLAHFHAATAIRVLSRREQTRRDLQDT